MADGNGNGENRTERWVKFTVMILIIGVGPIVGVAFSFNSRIVELETRQETYSHERMELDRATNQILQHISDQHEQMLRLMERLTNDDVYRRDSSRDSSPRRDGMLPAGGQR